MDKKEQLEKLMQNPAFVAETQNVNSINDLIALYNKYGVDVTAEDIAGMSKIFAAAKKTEEYKAKYATKAEKRDNTKALIAILIIGLIIFISGVPKIIRCTVPANAVVVATAEGTAFHNKFKVTVYRPVIEYEVDGTVYDEQWGTWTSMHSYIGDENVAIRYNASNPEDFVLDKYAGFTLANLFGAFMAAFAGIYLIIKKLFRA